MFLQPDFPHSKFLRFPHASLCVLAVHCTPFTTAYELRVISLLYTLLCRNPSNVEQAYARNFVAPTLYSKFFNRYTASLFDLTCAVSNKHLPFRQVFFFLNYKSIYHKPNHLQRIEALVHTTTCHVWYIFNQWLFLKLHYYCPTKISGYCPEFHAA